MTSQKSNDFTEVGTNGVAKGRHRLRFGPHGAENINKVFWTPPGPTHPPEEKKEEKHGKTKHEQNIWNI